jgi:hypothetical protein
MINMKVEQMLRDEWQWYINGCIDENQSRIYIKWNKTIMLSSIRLHGFADTFNVRKVLVTYSRECYLRFSYFTNFPYICVKFILRNPYNACISPGICSESLF